MDVARPRPHLQRLTTESLAYRSCEKRLNASSHRARALRDDGPEPKLTTHRPARLLLLLGQPGQPRTGIYWVRSTGLRLVLEVHTVSTFEAKSALNASWLPPASEPFDCSSLLVVRKLSSRTIGRRGVGTSSRSERVNKAHDCTHVNLYTSLDLPDSSSLLQQQCHKPKVPEFDREIEEETELHLHRL